MQQTMFNTPVQKYLKYFWENGKKQINGEIYQVLELEDSLKM